MGVLLLAQGDPEAKEMLKRAIAGRYGTTPPVIETMHAEFKGRARVKVGPIMTWIPMDMTTLFHFPAAMRFDFKVRPLKLPVQHGIESFDGETYRSVRRGSDMVAIAEEEASYSIRRRLWAFAALLLTPIGEIYVKLSQTGDSCFTALHTKLNDEVTLCLREDGKLDYVQVSCLNPDTEREQVFKLVTSGEQAPVDGLMLPKKIKAFWDDDPFFEAEPKSAETNLEIPRSIFRLEEELE